MPGAWEVSPSGSDPRSLSRGEEADPHRHPSLPLGVRGGLYLLEQGSPLEGGTLSDSYRQNECPAWSTPWSVFRPDPVGQVFDTENRWHCAGLRSLDLA